MKQNQKQLLELDFFVFLNKKISLIVIYLEAYLYQF